MTVNHYKQPWGDAENCPCGSKLAFRTCCKKPNELPLINVPNLNPPGPLTNYSHAKCFLRTENNCSTKISREHYMSASILAQFPRIHVTGLPGRPLNEPIEVPLKSLTAKILCQRHNSALSPLDDFAAKAFRSMGDAAAYAATHQRPGRLAHFLVSGDALELWAIKTMAGLYHSGVASLESTKVSSFASIRNDLIAKAFETQNLPQYTGLFVTQGIGIIKRQGLSVSSLIDTDRNEQIGINLELGPLKFQLFIVPPQDVKMMIAAKRYRVGSIEFRGPVRSAKVFLTWRHRRKTVDQLTLGVEPEDIRNIVE